MNDFTTQENKTAVVKLGKTTVKVRIEPDYNAESVTTQITEADGQGTYVSPSNMTSNRIYKWLNGIVNGTYRFSVTAGYEIIIQWRDPADPSQTLSSSENITNWITNDTTVLNKQGGGYGISVRKTNNSAISPETFDGVITMEHMATNSNTLYVEAENSELNVTASDSVTI